MTHKKPQYFTGSGMTRRPARSRSQLNNSAYFKNTSILPKAKKSPLRKGLSEEAAKKIAQLLSGILKES